MNTVEVIYPLADTQRIFIVVIEPSMTILGAIKKSGILEYYPQIDLDINAVGINSEIKKLEDLIQPFDRVEIYRPLVIDPMAARKLRADRAKKKN